MKKVLLLSSLAIMALAYGCDDEEPTKNSGNNQPQELCDSLAITYDGHIKTIVDSKCNTSGCHASAAGGFKLGTYAEVKAAAQKANFLGAIRHEAGFVAMPLSGDKLDDKLIQQFECWEKSSFPEN